MKISFVIPAHNEEAYIGKCLESINEELRRTAVEAPEIIVVNNASTDRTREIALGYPRVIVVQEPRKGLLWARQAGYLATHGELIASIDADAILPRGWLSRALKEFEHNKKLIALSGPFIYHDLSLFSRLLVAGYYYLGFLIYVVNRFVLHIGSMLQGGNIVVTRDALERIGGYNTTIEFYGEDTDLARRLYPLGPVKFSLRFPMYASGRRLKTEGVLTMGIRYSLNYFWMIFFGKPFNTTSTDIRHHKESQKPRRNKITSH